MTSKLDKVKCFFGFHQMQPVKYLNEVYKTKSSFVRYTRKCNCCGMEDIYVNKYHHWDGRESYVEKVTYVGDYSWYKLADKVLRRFKH